MELPRRPCSRRISSLLLLCLVVASAASVSKAQAAPIVELPAGATWVSTAPSAEGFARAMQAFLAQGGKASHRLRSGSVEREFIRLTGLPLNNLSNLRAAGVDTEAGWTLFELQGTSYLAVDVSSQRRLEKALDRWIRGRHLRHREEKRLPASGWFDRAGVVRAFSRSEGSRAAAGYAISGRFAVVLIDHRGSLAGLESALRALQSAAPVRPSVHAPLIFYWPQAAWARELWVGLDFHREGIDAKGTFRGLRRNLLSSDSAAGAVPPPSVLLPSNSPSSSLSPDGSQSWHPPLAAERAELARSRGAQMGFQWLMAPAGELKDRAGPLLWLRMFAGEGSRDLLAARLAEFRQGLEVFGVRKGVAEMGSIRDELSSGAWELVLPELNLDAVQEPPKGLGPAEGMDFLWSTTLRMWPPFNAQAAKRPGSSLLELESPQSKSSSRNSGPSGRQNSWSFRLSHDVDGTVVVSNSPQPAPSPGFQPKRTLLQCASGSPVAAARLEPLRLAEQLGSVGLFGSWGNPALMGLLAVNSEFGSLLKNSSPAVALGCEEPGERIRFQASWRLSPEAMSRL